MGWNILGALCEAAMFIWLVALLMRQRHRRIRQAESLRRLRFLADTDYPLHPDAVRTWCEKHEQLIR